MVWPGTDIAFFGLFGTRTTYDMQGRAAKTEWRVGVSLSLLDRYGVAVQEEKSADGPFSIRIEKTGDLVSQQSSEYNDKGQMVRSVGPTGADTLYVYDDQGRQIQTASGLVATVDSTELLRLVSQTDYDSEEKRLQIRKRKGSRNRYHISLVDQ